MDLIIGGIRTVDFFSLFCSNLNTVNKDLFVFKELMQDSVYKGPLNMEIILSHFSEKCLIQVFICWYYFFCYFSLTFSF